MKAVVVHGPRDLRVEEVTDPACGPGDVVVRMEWGGICGSDLAYWKQGATGTAILKRPMILGHEVAGRIAAVGTDVRGLRVGQAVTLHPATMDGDGQMPARLARRQNLYHRVRYLGSAALDPHTDGGFCGLLAVPAGQIRLLPENVSTRHGAVAEPLGVAIHAVFRAGDVADKQCSSMDVGR